MDWIYRDVTRMKVINRLKCIIAELIWKIMYETPEKAIEPYMNNTKKLNWKQVMALPVIQPCSVRAEIDTDTDSLVTKIVNQYKASKDAESDAKSVREKAGDWYYPIHVDMLAWNFFHNKVEKHLEKEYDNKLIVERELYYFDGNGNKVRPGLI